MFSRMAPAFERFPHDIFREIMLHTYVYTLKLHGEAEFDIEVPSPPIPASHVCRSWRRTLLSDPTMWTCLMIPEMSCKWIMELLRRSDSSLLNVFLVIDQDYTYGTSYDEASNTLSALFQQIHRFKILRVHITVWYHRPSSPLLRYMGVLIQEVASHLQRPAPQLRTLSFWYHHLNDRNTSPDYAVIKKLFSGDAPILKRINHRLSRDFLELECPVFHGLSELRLALDFSFGFNFGHFLDLLALSPCLRLLHLDVGFPNVWWPDYSSDCTVALSFLEKLMLNVNFMVELIGLVLKHVAFPSNVVWHIASRPTTNFEESPSISQFLARAHFTSLQIGTAFPSFAQLTLQETLNNRHINQYVYIYEEHLDMVMHALKFSSRITHMDLEVGNFSKFYRLFQTYLASMSSLKSLTIRPDISFHANDADEIHLVCLAALRSNPQDIEQALRNKNTTIEDLKLDLIPTDGLEDINPHNYNPSQTSTIPVFPCPLLHEVTVELRGPLKTNHAKILCACSDLRQNAGFPFQIHVHCPQIEQDVEEILGLRKYDTIKISASPLYVENKTYRRRYLTWY